MDIVDNHDLMREALLNEKAFIKNLSSADTKTARALLHYASQEQLNLIFLIIHNVVNGQIPLKIHAHKKLVKSKREPKLRKLKKKDDLEKMLLQTKEDKHKYLYQLCSVYPEILYSIVNES
jgi:hypothetical protein